MAAGSAVAAAGSAAAAVAAGARGSGGLKLEGEGLRCLFVEAKVLKEFDERDEN